jgi:hypothetical protein
MGYTPYTINNISVSGEVPSLVVTSSETINTNSSTIPAITSGKSYTILEKSGGDSTITINLTSGVISTTSSTTPDVYTLYIRNTGSYNISTFFLTVIENPTPTPTVQGDNSFRVYNLLLDEVENSTYLAQTGTYGSYNNSFTIYDIAVLELVNDALVDE